MGIIRKTKMKQNNSEIPEGCLKVIFFALIFPLVVLYGIFSIGYCSYHLWEWFICPVFNVREITLLEAYGISLTLLAFRPVHNLAKTEIDNGKLTISLLSPWFLLLSGYIIKFYVM